jgi:phenylacetyl-CoA:acceptor oxidoreductase subunit 2
VLDNYRPWLLVGGLVVPAAGVVAGLLIHSLAAPLFVVAGAAAAAAGLGFKFLLITRAGYNQGFALPHTPVRGTGQAGPAVKPGWTSAVTSEGLR